MVTWCWLAALAVGQVLLDEPFDAPSARVRCVATGAGRALVEDGRLVLDLTTPQAGKAAVAFLELDLPVPCVIRWDQRLAVDSPDAYYGGLRVTGGGGTLTVRRGGAGARHQVTCDGLPPTTVPPGDWVRCELTLEPERRALRLTDPATGRLLAAAAADLPSPPAPLRALFFCNQAPGDASLVDPYAQNRGRHEIDHLRIAAIVPPPPRPGQPYDPRRPLVFNRGLTWRDSPAGALAASRGDLPLTGVAAVSEWLCGPAVTTRANGDLTLFSRPHAQALGPDQVVLPQLQFHLGQHPRLVYDLRPTAARCRLRVTFTEPYLRHGVELAATPWTTTAVHGTIDLVAALAAWGESRVYAELDLVLELDAPPGESVDHGTVAGRLALPRVPAVIAPPQLVRPVGSGPVRLAAWPLIDETPTTVVSTHTTPSTRLARQGDLWIGDLDLAPGVHPGEVIATGPSGPVRQAVTIRVSASPFVVVRPGESTYGLADGTVLPPLLGDLFAWIPWLDPAPRTRRMLTSPESLPPGTSPRLTKWRALTHRELRERLVWLAESGHRVLRLTPNTSPRESVLDAGGHVAPHGLEQLQRVLGLCDELGLRALINLFHYQYQAAATGRYPPYQAYREAGYRGPADWTAPSTVRLQRGYLAELLQAVGADPAILGYTLFGENDQEPGETWVNETAGFVRERARQLLVFEQGGGLQSHGELRVDRWAAFAPARDGGIGYRTYYSDGQPVDAYANVCARWSAQRPPAFLAEACSAGPGWYSDRVTWVQPDFVTQVRDTLWASLLAPQAMFLTWSAPFSEAERRLPTRLAAELPPATWRRARGQLAVVVPAASRALLPALARLDAACGAAGVTYDLVATAPATGYAAVLDAAALPDPVVLPPAALAERLLDLSPGTAATILTSESRRHLVAWLRNSTGYQRGPGYGRGVQELHRQRTGSRPVSVGVRGLSDDARVTLWSVDTGEVVWRGRLGDRRTLTLAPTPHDFALVVTEPEARPPGQGSGSPSGAAGGR